MTENAQTSDEDLLRRSASGDEEAFVSLYRRRQAGVFRFALHMCGSKATAEEVVQEVFLSLIRNPERFDGSRGPLSAFLLGIARNQVLKSYDRDRPYVALDDDPSKQIPANDPLPLSELTRAEDIEEVRQAVLALPPPYRESVVLCDLEEMSYADAAALLSIPIGTLRSRLNRGRQLLVEKVRSKRKPASGFSAMGCIA